MELEVIKAAINNKLLREYDPRSAKLHDRVLRIVNERLYEGKVIAIYYNRAIFGWADGAISTHDREHPIEYQAPLFWVEDQPVYAGNILYCKEPWGLPGGYEITGVSKDGLPLYRDIAFVDSASSLTWLKKCTVNINGHDVPSPERYPLFLDTPYYIPSLSNVNKPTRCIWKGLDSDYKLLYSGIVHLSGASAIKHAEALVSLTSNGK